VAVGLNNSDVAADYVSKLKVPLAHACWDTLLHLCKQDEWATT
jgi:hypothetical protein